MTAYVHVITEFIHGKPSLYHVVKTTERKAAARAWNQEVASVNAFRRFCYGFFKPGKPAPALAFGVQFKEDFDREGEIIAHAELPKMHYETIFEFYAAIGFDYKRKKFINTFDPDIIDIAALALARFDASHNGHTLHDDVTVDKLIGGELYRKKARAVIAALDDATGFLSEYD